MNERKNILPGSDDFRVNHQSPTPLYHQIYLHIRELITSNQLAAGEMLPPEIDLANFFSVGRHTIRQALSKLVDERLVERFSGRGTFVCKNEKQENFYLDRSFTQQMAALGLIAHSKVLEKRTGMIDESSPVRLRSKMGVPFLQLTRIRYGGDLPFGVQNSTILTDRCPKLDQYDFSKESLYNILSSVYHLEISEIHNEFSANNANEEQSKLLSIKTGTPILLENSVTYLADGEPIEATACYYRSDKYRYSIRFKYRGFSKHHS